MKKILAIKFQDILIIMKTCFCGVKIFLKNESFMPYHGKNEAFALLFPMEKNF